MTKRKNAAEQAKKKTRSDPRTRRIQELEERLEALKIDREEILKQRDRERRNVLTVAHQRDTLREQLTRTETELAEVRSEADRVYQSVRAENQELSQRVRELHEESEFRWELNKTLQANLADRNGELRHQDAKILELERKLQATMGIPEHASAFVSDDKLRAHRAERLAMELVRFLAETGIGDPASRTLADHA